MLGGRAASAQTFLSVAGAVTWTPAKLSFARKGVAMSNFATREQETGEINRDVE